MKKTILISMIATALLSTSAFASADKGQKVYLKILKSKFNENGAKFAAEHTTDEWNDLFKNNAAGFIKEYSAKFPNAKILLENPENIENWKNVGDFAKEYSSDSGNVPSCGG